MSTLDKAAPRTLALLERATGTIAGRTKWHEAIAEKRKALFASIKNIVNGVRSRFL